MDSLLKAQIHDKMKPGIGYNNTPPPYNNNYIPPTSDLLETKEIKDLTEKAFKIDPLDEVMVKDLTEKEASENRNNAVSKEIPLENNIITNEGCGKIWVKSKEIEKTKGKDYKVHYKQTTVVNPGPCKQCACNKSESLNSGIKRGNQRNWNNQWAQKQGVDLNKIIRPKPCFICGKLNLLANHCFFNPINQQMNFQRFVQKSVGYRKAGKKHVVKKSVETKGPMKIKVLKESIKIWVPRSTKTVSTADRDSATRSITAATSVSTTENINATNTVSTSSKVNTANTVTAANTVTTSNKVSTAKHASAANAVSTSKTSTASSKCVSKPIIVTKYSRNEESKFKNLVKKECKYFDEKGGNQQLKGKSIWHVDSGCSWQMTGNMSCLQDFKHINGGHVAFGDNLIGGKISGKGNVTKGKMTFEDVYYVDQLKYNLLIVPQVCDKQHSILFTNTECMIHASEFKVDDESMILLRTPRMDNVYCLDMDNVSSDSSLNCLVSKASVDESSLWHRRMCHMNFKTMNKLVKNNLLLHMDLFGPTNVMSIGKKSYCFVIVDDYSRFTWVYFLRTKDETSGLIKYFILRIENQTNQKVKVIRSDNGTEFKNIDLNTFCEEQGIERQYSAPRTPQQNGVAERKNRTLIEAARSLLADSKLPITFWAEAVNIACYVQNRVLVVKPKNKTPYELLNKRKPFIGFFKPFGCPCIILNTKSHHYRSMIDSLMYLTASRPDIMFPVCVCARFQVRTKQSHYQAVKRIFRYLKGQPRLGLWYPHDSSFDLLAYLDSDLGRANLDRKSTSEGCQFLGARLVSWQCKKQTTVSTSTTEAEYIAAASCCSQVLWIQNQMLDYGVTFLHTPIFIDNSSAISIVNNTVKHSKTNHIEIRYHFIRDCNEKKLIQVVKVHTDNQFADLFTKAFDEMYGSTQFITSLKSLILFTVNTAYIPQPINTLSPKEFITTLCLLFTCDLNPFSLKYQVFRQELSTSMASMAFINEHNEIAMLQKPTQAEGFQQIVDFLRTSHIAHALTVSPTIFIEHQRQFWANATIVTENGVQMIKTRVCEKPLTVTEEVLRICLRLDDAAGITSIPNEELFSTLSRMGYEGQMGMFKFFKAKFSPQWRFFVHTLMHCISKKTTGWSQFSSPIAYALVCLSTARKYNFSQMIFNDLVSNLDNKKSFFMYRRFVQILITNELTDIPHFDGVYVPKPPKGKVFSNLR
ncbi:hypothetical protein L6452_27650 [Arctium lappa]|uniref:Uncharacterized protein n=1 Tax=Arctium lappa TaxID=4217 RepID=A0ACB8ZVM6_ARCLA|nr:hypothetical protein L6452_27650 [Arctium lappa]